MKQAVTKFKSMGVALQELSRFIGPTHILSGKPFKKFGGMRPREAIANWLL